MVHSRRETSRQRRSSSIGENSRVSATPGIYRCKLCKKFHPLKVCPKFLWMTPKERKNLVLKEVYCINCLARSHRFRDCRSANMCRKCGRPHHTLLHASYLQDGSNQRNLNESSNRQRNRNMQKSKQTIKNRQDINNRSNNSESATLQSNQNQQILSEAIRALASVLCSNQK
ncbi:uncharacterized protein LOC142233277 [Haematobia irritans]|uniref:uncharacterized protein LOC142233277 n=1 Tax=Haematobia irritans TaxID=7368 RepID=UPI003F4F69A1